MQRAEVDRNIGDAVNDAVTRTAAVGGLVGIAVIHVLQSPEAFGETTYLGLLFIGAIVASLALSATLSLTSDQRVWGAAGGLAALILLGYLFSRTSGLPAATNDVGEWTEPLGLVSMVVEGLLICLSAGVLGMRVYASGSRVARPSETRGRPAPGTRPDPAAPLG